MGVGGVEGSHPPPRQPVGKRLTDQGGAIGTWASSSARRPSSSDTLMERFAIWLFEILPKNLARSLLNV
jgi:hypothetical protein